MVNALDSGIVVSEFELLPLYYGHVYKYSWEMYEFPYPPIYGLNSTTKKVDVLLYKQTIIC